jgi:nicotinamidase-related amidase
MGETLQRPLGAAVHLCIDMQRLFSTEGPWPTPWMERVLPAVTRVAEHAPACTIFTRFIPPERARDMPGTWRLYYEKWSETTREKLDPRLLELMPPLQALVPPAAVFDKPVYSAFAGRRLAEELKRREVQTLIVTGSETDVCVLATVLGAVDHGYRVVLVSDGLCSSSDEGHDTLLSLYRKRFSAQIETVPSEILLGIWEPGGP